MGISGDLRIVPRQDLGELGTDAGEAVVAMVTWERASAFFTRSRGKREGEDPAPEARGPLGVCRALPWMFLIVLLVQKPNRKWRAQMALIPLAVVWLCTEPLKGKGAVFIGDMVILQLLAITLLWLFSHRLIGRNRHTSLVGAVLVTAIPALCTLLSWVPHDVMTGSAVAVYYLAGSVSLPLAMTSAALSCRSGYAPGRFRLWFFISLLVLPIFVIAVAAALMFPYTAPGWTSLLASSVVPGLLTGALACLCSVFHVALLSRNSLYRDRFQRVLRLSGMEASAP